MSWNEQTRFKQNNGAFDLWGGQLIQRFILTSLYVNKTPSLSHSDTLATGTRDIWPNETSFATAVHLLGQNHPPKYQRHAIRSTFEAESWKNWKTCCAPGGHGPEKFDRMHVVEKRNN